MSAAAPPAPGASCTRRCTIADLTMTHLFRVVDLTGVLGNALLAARWPAKTARIPLASPR